MRLKILRIIVVVLFAVIACTLFYLQAIKGRFYFNQSVNNRIRVVPLDGWRGKIKDRNGVILADNKISYDVYVTPQDISSDKKVFDFVGDVLGVSETTLLQRFSKRRLTPFAPVVIAEDITQQEAIQIEESRVLYPSLLVQENHRRIYPLGEAASHVVGYVGRISQAQFETSKRYGYTPRSIVGYSGIEEYYDSYIKGTEGGLQIEVNSRGQQVQILGFKEPSKGQDVTLTIDSQLQKHSKELLNEQVGVIIVMDTSNGEILTLSSSPDYDPNIFVDREKRKEAYKYFSNPQSPLLNRAIKGLFPPGSVFKIPVSICALSSKKATEHTTFKCEGFIEVGGIKFGCTHSHGEQNMIEAIAHSCNVYFYQLAMILGEELIGEYAKALGLGSKTYIDLPYEKQGFIPSRRERQASGKGKWYTGDTLNLSIGQGDVLVTPLQLVKMVSTIANDGLEVQPHLIKEIGGKKDNKYSFARKIDIDKSVYEKVKLGMRATVEEYSGTANVLDISGLEVAGKTGTAQSSGRQEHHAWFAGYAKGKEKTLAFCVLLEHGGSSQNANLVARQLLLNLKKNKVL